MNIKDFDTFIFDLDGTVYNNNHRMHPSNFKMIQQLNKIGKQVYIATGRNFNLIKGTLEMVNSDFPAITINGGLVRNYKTGELLHSDTISHEDSIRVIKLMEKYEIQCVIYTIDGIIFNTDPYQSKAMVITVNLNDADLVPGARFNIIKSHQEFTDFQVIKFDIATQGVSAQNFYKFRRELKEQLPNLNGFFSSPYIFELMLNSVSKGNAIKYLADTNKIDLERTIVFGDEANDISSALVAKYFVAMANANPQLLKHTKYKTKLTNDQGGVADYIENEMGLTYE